MAELDGTVLCLSHSIFKTDMKISTDTIIESKDAKGLLFSNGCNQQASGVYT